FPASGCDGGGSTCLTEEQIFNELYAFLPTQGWTGDPGVGPSHPAKSFAVFLPRGVVDCFYSSWVYGCSANASNGAYYCAYHPARIQQSSTRLFSGGPASRYRSGADVWCGGRPNRN